jgi:tRNA threonylcarbamoyladenosine biosynthesis protein TsaE
VVLVSGELGSGKTTFVRGACRALGVEGPVTSPTFTVGHVLGGSPEVAHLDLYRLGSLAAEPSLERIAARVLLEHLGGDRRRITIDDRCFGP